MTIRAFEIPAYLVCGECGFALQVLTDPRPVLGKTAYRCVNGSCKQFDQPFWHHYREVTLDDKPV